MRFPANFLDEIRARVSISSVVGRAVQWDRRKSNAAKGDYWACCPFHNEKTPSFHADDRRGHYHCFGCKQSGDIFTFLTEQQGLNFAEAVEQLAREAGLEMPQVTPEQVAQEKRRATLFEVLEMAKDWFCEQLTKSVGAAARGYLADRGLTAEIQKQFAIGFAPADRQGLVSHLRSLDITDEQLLETGLLVIPDDGKPGYDRFRDRIIFPINDVRGRVIAFGGRAMRADNPAKYLNSPEGPLFHKGQILYNFDRARSDAHSSAHMVVVEGYMDVIAMSRAGISQSVAPLGTALTVEQLALLWRTVPEPVMCFDGDEAGLKAAWRAMDIALPNLQPGKSLRFVVLPEGCDPDDILRDEGAAAVQELVSAALPLSEMLWRRSLSEHRLDTPEQRARFEAALDEQISRIGENRVRGHYQKDISARLRDLWQRTSLAGGNRRSTQTSGQWQNQSAARRPGQYGSRRAQARPLVLSRRGFRQKPLAYDYQLPASNELTRSPLATGNHHSTAYLELAEKQLLYGLINHPDLLDNHAEMISETTFIADTLDSLRQEILDIAALYPGLDMVAMRDHLNKAGKSAELERIDIELARNKLWFLEPDAALSDAEAGFNQLLMRHRKAVILQRALRQAERELAENPSEDALNHLNEIREQLNSGAEEAATIEGFGEASGRSVDRVV